MHASTREIIRISECTSCFCLVAEHSIFIAPGSTLNAGITAVAVFCLLSIGVSKAATFACKRSGATASKLHVNTSRTACPLQAGKCASARSVAVFERRILRYVGETVTVGTSCFDICSSPNHAEDPRIFHFRPETC